MEVKSSGADVPKATTVNPMMSGDTPMLSARPTAPRTKMSPAKKSSATPTARIKKLKSMKNLGLGANWARSGIVSQI